MPINRRAAGPHHGPAGPSRARLIRRTVTVAVPTLLAALTACTGESTLTVDGTAGPAGLGSPSASSDQPSPNSSKPKSSKPSSSKPSGSSPGTSLVTSTKGVFSGVRQFRLLPLNSESTFAVDNSRQVGLSDDFGKASLFTASKFEAGSTKYQIQTANPLLNEDGVAEIFCLEVQRNGARPMTISVESCDGLIAGQAFQFSRNGTTETGEPTFSIRTGPSTYLIQDPQGDYAPAGNGATAVVLDGSTGDLPLSFLLPDLGGASLPATDGR